ncbi:hypothetical protein HME9302_02048 [Alteripontixanthobacter maritimus]|uniref:Phospholipase D n=1 Tax=Alteripontixanthobacter maritimus TaxID=2161824 RepID=A0A369Q8M4_9SPHN|nr:cardiolipin synthase B [Alteripontixanthobacter maritimus]RDC60832.1 hypothetical protein HME9302_02048 [Alteripontixanthobacter maritimus]
MGTLETTEGEAAATANDYRDPEPFDFESQGQSLRFYPAGEDRRNALIELVRNAQTSLKLCFYIFAEDEVSTALRDELVAAAARGVNCVLITDRFGSPATDEFFAPYTDAGGRHFSFSSKWTHRYLIRNHQKMAIADDSRAMFGGFNIEDDYFNPPNKNGWNDIGVHLEGTAVEGLVKWFAKLHDWTDDGEGHFSEIRDTADDWVWTGGTDNKASWLVGGPTRGLSTWAQRVRDDFDRASRLDLFMAYFSPPKKFMKRIGAIARRGEVRLLMAGKSDNNATLGATRSLYHYLLSEGAKIWEFEPCKLHTKLVVVDNAVYLGSANFDMRSLYLNLEIMLRLDDPALARRMREFVSDHIAASREITPERHRRRATLWNRVRWNLGWLLVSGLDYNISRRLNLGL